MSDNEKYVLFGKLNNSTIIQDYTSVDGETDTASTDVQIDSAAKTIGVLTHIKKVPHSLSTHEDRAALIANNISFDGGADKTIDLTKYADVNKAIASVEFVSPEDATGNKLIFKNEAGTTVKELNISGFEQEQSDWTAEAVKPDGSYNETYIKNKPTTLEAIHPNISTEVNSRISTKAAELENSISELDAGIENRITAKISELDISLETIDPAESIASISETDGKIEITKQAIHIAESQVTNLEADLASKSNATNLENGTSTDSIILKYTGNIDATHFGNTNTGESATVLGEANSNTANRALLAGKLNRSSAPNSIIAGLGNGRGIGATPDIAEVISGQNVIIGGHSNRNINSNEAIVSGSYNKNENGNLSIVAGEANYNKKERSLVIGTSNQNETNNAVVCGNFSYPYQNAFLSIGNGTSVTDRKNAFTVFAEGYAEVQTQGTTAASITTKAYVDGVTTLASESDINNLFS